MKAIYDRLVQVGDCWEWTGSRGHAGHGNVHHQGRSHLTHRLVWEDMCGPIPDGLELDHLCRNPPCCNPSHLDPVTHAENMRRGIQSFSGRIRCGKGHLLTPMTVIARAADGRQQCRACRNEARRARRARKRALGLRAE
jgi:hypothetical protein